MENESEKSGTAAGSPEVARGDALEELAKRLHSKMEHLDPTDSPKWENLTDRQKDFYRICVEEICLFPDLVAIVVEDEEY